MYGERVTPMATRTVWCCTCDRKLEYPPDPGPFNHLCDNPTHYVVEVVGEMHVWRNKDTEEPPRGPDPYPGQPGYDPTALSAWPFVRPSQWTDEQRAHVRECLVGGASCEHETIEAQRVVRQTTCFSPSTTQATEYVHKVAYFTGGVGFTRCRTYADNVTAYDEQVTCPECQTSRKVRLQEDRPGPPFRVEST